MAKAQPVFHAPTGVLISPGTAGYELTGKARDKHMAELDAKYRETAGLLPKKQQDKIEKLGMDLLSKASIVHVNHRLTNMQTGSKQKHLILHQVELEATAEEVKAAIRHCIVSAAPVYEMVGVRDEVPQPYRLKSIEAWHVPARTVMNQWHPGEDILMPSPENLQENVSGLKFPSIIFYEDGLWAMRDGITAKDPVSVFGRVLKEWMHLIPDDNPSQAILVFGVRATKEEKK